MKNLYSSKFKPSPYWHEDINIMTSNEDERPKSSDIVIVGAGFTGLATAVHLLKAGKSVVIYDAMTLGDGASGKNGGMIGPSFHKLGLSGLKAIHGESKAYGILQEGLNAIQYLPSFLKQENIECDLNLSGRFNGVHNHKQWLQIQRNCEDFSQLEGFKYHMVEPSDTRSEIGSDHYKGGVVYGLDGSVHPQKLVAGLARRVVELGGQIFENSVVTDIDKQQSGYHLSVNGATVTADKVVIATNAYSKTFKNKKLKHFYKRLIPLTSAMVATEELPTDVMARLFPNNRIYGGNHRLVQYYRPSPDGKRILFGARGVDLWDRADKNGSNLVHLLVKIFPELKGIKIDHSWSGKVAYTFDHGPHIGEHDGLYYAMGFCGSGVTRTVYLAKKLSMQILGEEGYETAFHGLNFPTKPFYNGKPWFMPLIIKWHGFMDRIE